jgi:Hint domain
MVNHCPAIPFQCRNLAVICPNLSPENHFYSFQLHEWALPMTPFKMGIVSMFSWNKTSWGTDDMDTFVACSDGLISDTGYGIVAGTKVATVIGWRPVESIVAGDQVLTFDGGLQTVIEVRRQILFAAATSVPYAWRPLQVPIGALGNRTTMHILPGQNVLIESDIAEELYGDPFALIPAAALEGYKGITRADPTMRIEVATLHFAQDQIVYANIGALFMCPRAGDLMHDLFATPVPTPYKALSMSEAIMVLSWLEVEDAGIAACA